MSGRLVLSRPVVTVKHKPRLKRTRRVVGTKKASLPYPIITILVFVFFSCHVAQAFSSITKQPLLSSASQAAHIKFSPQNNGVPAGMP